MNNKLGSLKTVGKKGRREEGVAGHFREFLEANGIKSQVMARQGVKLPRLDFHEQGQLNYSLALAQEFLRLHGYDRFSASIRPSLVRSKVDKYPQGYKFGGIGKRKIVNPVILFHKNLSQPEEPT
ncbi:MAG: hypothetical protein AABX01_00595 [Candidatus Micrarchaeota archaeon]